MEVTINHQIEAFFDAYAARFNNALGDHPKDDIDGTIDSFADCFVEASPVGVSCGQNNADFRERIPKGNAFYRSIGTQSMKIISLNITPLDDYHAQAKVHWQADYKKQDSSEDTIDFDVIYFLQLLGGKPKIFAYITGDEQKVYKERGIIPG